jgi:hypothetical protein
LHTTYHCNSTCQIYLCNDFIPPSKPTNPTVQAPHKTSIMAVLMIIFVLLAVVAGGVYM